MFLNERLIKKNLMSNIFEGTALVHKNENNEATLGRKEKMD
jgi:hypothetical protein